MPAESIELTIVLPAAPERVFAAWMSSAEHAAFTGGRASLEERVGASYTAWDGYIRGTTLELEPGRRIVQTWRTDEFPTEVPDSRLEITLAPDPDGTLLTLAHTQIPEGLAQRYEEGWLANYFEPMRTYFRGVGPRTEEALTVLLPRKVPRRKAAARKAARKAERPGRKVARKPRPAAKRTPAKAAPRRGARKAPAGRTARKPSSKKTSRKVARKPVRRSRKR